MKLEIKELVQIRNKYPKQVPFHIFIESGTLTGDTITAMEPHFQELHTIEIKPDLYNRVKEKYRHLSKIHFHLGDTSKMIDKVLAEVGNKPVIFFLDAHWSYGNTGKGDIEVPLLEELQLINRVYNQDCIIIIDDYRLFNGNDPYVDWSRITEPAILSCIDSEKIISSYAENDRFILFCKKIT